VTMQTQKVGMYASETPS